jgi:hypothetical protein
MGTIRRTERSHWPGAPEPADDGNHHMIRPDRSTGHHPAGVAARQKSLVTDEVPTARSRIINIRVLTPGG